MSITDRLKNWWSYQPPSKEGELNQPLTGGNNYTIQKEFKARMNNMLNQVNLSNDNLDSIVYDEYFLMLFQKNYFVNLFDIKTDDIEFRRCWNLAVETAFWYGDFAIINKGVSGVEEGEYLVPVYVASKTHTPLGGIEKDFKYQYASNIIPLMSDSKMWGEKPDSKVIANLMVNKDDFVYGKWNTQGYGAWVWMYKFIRLQKELMYLAHGSAYLQKEILFYKVNNTDTVKDEIAMLYNPKMNIVPTMGISWDDENSALENRWLSDKLSHDSTMTINDVYDWTINKYYELFGRKYNIDSKRERNVTNEVEASQEQFAILINETKKYMEIALKECEEKFGKKGELLLDYERSLGENQEGNNEDEFENNNNNNRETAKINRQTK